MSNSWNKAAVSADVINRVGVNTHMDTDHYTVARTLMAMDFLGGLRNARDAAFTGGMTEAYAKQNEMIAAGVDYALTVGGTFDIGYFQEKLNRMDEIHAMGGLTVALGWNEPEFPIAAEGGVTFMGQTQWDAVKLQQQMLYQHVKSHYPDVITAMYSASDWAEQDRADAAIKITKDADVGLGHIYAYDGTSVAPALYNGQSYSAKLASEARYNTEDVPLASDVARMVITETGAPSADPAAGSPWYQNRVDMLTQAKIVLNEIVGALGPLVDFTTGNINPYGAELVYVYELLDTLSDPGFGLFTADGTPKPAAYAVRNLMNVLKDPSAFSHLVGDDVAPVTISNLKGDEHVTLFHASNKVTAAVWGETSWVPQKIYNAATENWDTVGGSDPGKPDSTITVNFGKTFGFLNSHDPLDGTSIYHGWGNELTMTIRADHPTLYEAVLPVNEIIVVQQYYDLIRGDHGLSQGEASGVRHHVESMMLHGTPQSNLASAFLNSSEGQARYAHLNDMEFATALYKNVLHRDPDAEGLANHYNALANGAARVDIARSFVQSLEHDSQYDGAVRAFADDEMLIARMTADHNTFG